MNAMLIDIGNTALKWAWADSPAAPQTVVHVGLADLRPALRERWAGLAPHRVLACSVASDLVVHAVADALAGCRIEWQRAQARFEGPFTLVNGYREPLALGTDRWHAAIGAASLHPGEALLVVHVGTATTVDSVVPEPDGSLRFAGGRIAPGPVLMRDSLARGTARLPHASGVRVDFPDNTMDAISTGVLDAQAGLVERAARAMRAAGHPPRLLLAGGAAQEIAPLLLPEFERAEVEHNLVLRGLALRAEHSLKKP
ncbi:MAG: type III pantothenate kinase [Burkholderiaceae bacterium]